jgi:S1-C subfamily serine protease
MTPLAPLALALACLSDPQDVVAALENAVADAIERAQPSVVAVTRIKSESGETTAIRGRNAEPLQAAEGLIVERPGLGFDPNPDRPGFPRPGEPQFAPEYYALPGDFGSGVVVGDESDHAILTTYHLIKGAARIRVRAPGVQFDAEVIAADPRSDLAVVAPREGSNPEMLAKLRPLPIGKAEALRQGAFLVALGNPYNSARDGKASASLGILSNVARQVEPPIDTDLGQNIKQFFRYQPTLLQLDSKLNLGMSGGAVVTLRGELVGLTTSAASPAGFDAAAGYAIPMDALGRRAVAALAQGKEVEYGFIGIGLGAAPNTVSTVQPNTPAWKANLAENDVILQVGDTVLAEDDGALSLALAGVAVGEPVKLKVLHHGEVKELTLVMSKYPVAGDVIATNRPEPWRGARIDFTSVLTGGMNTTATLQSMSRGGVGVVEVLPGTPASAAGLTAGLAVTEVEGTPVSTPAEFRKAVAELDGKPVNLETVGGLSSKAVTVPPE